MRKPIIGKSAKVVQSTNESDVGMSGKIVDESRDSITLATGRGEKKLWKQNVILEMNNKKMKVPAKRTAERMKA
jgi:RNase P/RNase MRP subunit p29